MSIVIYSDFDGVFNIHKTKETRTTMVNTQNTEFLKRSVLGCHSCH